MKYEIPREAFKQRLEERMNFVFVDLLPAEKTPVKFENVVHINYDSQFKTQFSSQFPNKNQTLSSTVLIKMIFHLLKLQMSLLSWAIILSTTTWVHLRTKCWIKV